MEGLLLLRSAYRHFKIPSTLKLFRKTDSTILIVNTRLVWSDTSDTFLDLSQTGHTSILRRIALIRRLPGWVGSSDSESFLQDVQSLLVGVLNLVFDLALNDSSLAPRLHRRFPQVRPQSG